MRIACLWIPDLPLVAALRAEPALASVPMVVVRPPPEASELSSRARVLGASGPAQAEGIAPGLTLAEAQGRCPDLRVRAASPERMRAAAQAAVDAAASVSPRVEEASPGLIFLEAEGLTTLFGDDQGVAAALLRAAEGVGLCAAVGLAEGKLAARLAAGAASAHRELRTTRHGVGGGAKRVVAREEQRRFLGTIPLEPLCVGPEGAAALGLPTDAPVPGPELLRAAHRFGLRTLGELVALPAGALSARLGPEGALLHRLGRGEDTAPLVAQTPPERFAEGEELEWEVSALEPLLFLWKSLLDRLSARLGARGLAARELRLLLRLADGAWDERAIDLAAPTREPGPLLQLLKLEVEARPPSLGVCAARLEARVSAAAREQLPLFGPRTGSPAQLAAAVARISALVGPERVGQAVAHDRHQPFAAGVVKFAPPPAPLFAPAQQGLQQPMQSLRAAQAGQATQSSQSIPSIPSIPAHVAEAQLAARPFRPPRKAEVRCDGEGSPLLVICEGAMGGRVVAWAGPWSTEAEWWTQGPIALDSYDLELAGGLLLRASLERVSGEWWIEAVYD
jgi:protein ImuB